MNEFIAGLAAEDLQIILTSRGLETEFEQKAELIKRVLSCMTEEDTIEIVRYDEHDIFEDSLNEEDMSTNFLFKDVEDALEKFSGETEKNVESWLTGYEAVATTCKWNDIQKYLFARKLLIGAARKAIEADDAIVSYELLTAKLRKEFPDDITIGDIHEKLVKRKKLPAESYLEYFYEMQRIAKKKMDEKSIIQYIVNGIQDSTLGKAILYVFGSFKVKN